MLKVLISLAIAFSLACIVVATSTAQENPAGGNKQAEVKNGLVIEQVCNGFPGSDEKKKKTKQKIIIKGDRIYMQNLETPDTCIVRGDKKLIWEVDTDRKKYTLRKFEYFEELKANNEKDRKEFARIINATPDPKARMKLAEKRGYLADEKGKVSTKPQAKTVDTKEEKVINGFKCYHLKVYEDAKVVLDVWLTKEHKSPDSLMDFYKKLGCFCDEVIAEMAKIRDFPVLLKAHLAFGAMAIPIECEIAKIENKNIEDKVFELPKDCECEKEIGKTTKIIGECVCPVCGKKFDPQKNKPYNYVHKNIKFLLCSRECSKKLGKAIAKHKGDEQKALDELRKTWKKEKGK